MTLAGLRLCLFFHIQLFFLLGPFYHFPVGVCQMLNTSQRFNTSQGKQMGSKLSELNPDIIKRILLSVLTNHTHRAIQNGTGKPGRWKEEKVKPAYIEPYLTEMTTARLVKTEPYGKRKKYTITERGMQYLMDTSLFETLKTVNAMLEASKKPELQPVFLNLRNMEYLKRHEKLMQYFAECCQKGIPPFDEMEKMSDKELKRIGQTSVNGYLRPSPTMDAPLFELVKKLFELQLIFAFQELEAEKKVNTHWAIFAPKMELWLLRDVGSNAKTGINFLDVAYSNLDNAIYEVEHARNSLAANSWAYPDQLPKDKNQEYLDKMSEDIDRKYGFTKEPNLEKG